MLDEHHLEGWSVARHLVVQHFEMPLLQEFLPIVVEDLGKGTMVPVRRMPWGLVFHATILLMHRWRSRTEFEKALGCCLPADEEHSKE